MASHKLKSIQVIFRSLEGDEEKRQVIDLLNKVFQNEIFGKNLTEAVWAPKYFNAEHTKVAIVESKVVSVVVFGIREIRFPPCLIRAATIGPVATDKKHRGLGLSSRLLNHTLCYIESLGINIAYIQGIPDYYSKFGFYPYLAKSKVRINNESLNVSKKSSVAKYQPCFLPRLKSIFNESTNERICAAYRDEEIWDWLTGPAQASYYFYKPMVIRGDDGSINGYLTSDPDDPLNIRELVIDHSVEACEATLSAVKGMALGLGRSEFEIKLPWDDYFMTYIRMKHQGMFVQYCQSDGGSLMKFINPASVFQILQPYFADRLKRVAMPDTELSITTESLTVSFSIYKNSLFIGNKLTKNNLNLSSKLLPGLVSGYYSYKQLSPFLTENNLVDNVALSTLFPTEFPFIYQGDNY